MKSKLPLLVLLAAFPPLSTDMYLAALPVLQKQYNQPFCIVNLTLVFFFIAYCIFMLIYGPLSDRYGRKPILLIGISVYTIGSYLCPIAHDIYFLIFLRTIQGAGGAAASVIAMAICKDIYEGTQREKVLAYIAIITSIAPMIGPIIGGYVMTYLTWHYVFIIQGILGCIAIFGVIRLNETLHERIKINIKKLSHSYLYFFKNRKYIFYVILSSVSVFPFFSFIGGSPDMYIIGFNVSKEAFGYYFAINAFGMMIGAFSCSKLVDYLGSNNILSIGFSGTFIAGIFLFIFANGPNIFALIMFIFTIFLGLTRPTVMNKALNQAEQNAGIASSLIMVTYFLIGSFGMWLISLNWQNKVSLLAIFCIFAEGIVLLLWVIYIAVKNIKKTTS